MNVKSGLSRLWVVASVVWISGVVYLDWKDVDAYFSWTVNKTILLKQYEAAEKRHFSCMKFHTADQYGDGSCDEFKMENPYAKFPSETVILALSIPIVVRLLGWVFFWVWRGFKPEHPGPAS